MICSTAVFMVTNSEPNVDDFTVFCFLENQETGAQFKNIKMPVCDLRVTWLPAWSTSTKQFIVTSVPRGAGMLWEYPLLHQGKIPPTPQVWIKTRVRGIENAFRRLVFLQVCADQLSNLLCLFYIFLLSVYVLWHDLNRFFILLFSRVSCLEMHFSNAPVTFGNPTPMYVLKWPYARYFNQCTSSTLYPQLQYRFFLTLSLNVTIFAGGNRISAAISSNCKCIYLSVWISVNAITF